MLMVLKKVAYEHSLINDRKECLVLGVMGVLRRCQDICISQTRCDTTPLQPEEGSHKAKGAGCTTYSEQNYLKEIEESV